MPRLHPLQSAVLDILFATSANTKYFLFSSGEPNVWTQCRLVTGYSWLLDATAVTSGFESLGEHRK